MVIMVTIILVLMIIGVVLVVRSGEREVELDEKDHELPIASEQFQMLPSVMAEAPHDIPEKSDSWTLDSVENESDKEAESK